MNSPSFAVQSLLDLFPQVTSGLGTLEAVPAAELPNIYRQLLDHDPHVTATVEA